jgi:hypothetical protein
MPRSHEPNRVALLPEPIKNSQKRLARHTKDGVNALRDQLVGNDVATESLHANGSSRKTVYR